MIEGPDSSSPRFPLRLRFRLGGLFITPGASDALEALQVAPFSLLDRHAASDWGNLDAEDWERNDQSLRDGTRVLSAYQVSPDVRVWIITEADRAQTTILLPSEY